MIRILKRAGIPLILSAGIAAGISLVLYTNISQRTRTHIRIEAYTPQRDEAQTVAMFQENWYWMIPFAPEEYQLERRLAEGISDLDPAVSKPMTVMVARSEDTVVGLVAYYQKTKRKGFILFLITDQRVRRSGVAKQLLAHAVKDLQSRGSTVVELGTKTDNIRAQSLYRSQGFIETRRDDSVGFMWFEKPLA